MTEFIRKKKRTYSKRKIDNKRTIVKRIVKLFIKKNSESNIYNYITFFISK